MARLVVPKPENDFWDSPSLAGVLSVELQSVFTNCYFPLLLVSHDDYDGGARARHGLLAVVPIVLLLLYV